MCLIFRLYLLIMINGMLSAVSGGIVFLVKAIGSMLAFFFGLTWRILRYILCVLPITGVALILCMAGLLYTVCTTNSYWILLSPIPIQLSEPLSLFLSVTDWWAGWITQERSQPAYLCLLILSLLLAIPVLGTLLIISGAVMLAPFLLYTLCADLILIVLEMLLLRKGPAQLIRSRYFRLFPAAADKAYDREYRRWLRKHHGEFEPGADRHRRPDDFYEEDDADYDDSYSDEAYYDEDEYDEAYEDEYDEDYDEDYDEAYEEDELDEDYEEDLIEHIHRRAASGNRQRIFYDMHEGESGTHRRYDRQSSGRNEHSDSRREESGEQRQKATGGSFDFFAGATSRESVEKKYRALVKLYHPDNSDGDTQALQEINRQYAIAKKRFTNS